MALESVVSVSYMYCQFTLKRLTFAKLSFAWINFRVIDKFAIMDFAFFRKSLFPRNLFFPTICENLSTQNFVKVAMVSFFMVSRVCSEKCLDPWVLAH